MQINSQQKTTQRRKYPPYTNIIFERYYVMPGNIKRPAAIQGNTNPSSSTTLPAPTIDLTTKNQGTYNCLLFSKWITLYTTIQWQYYRISTAV